MDATAAQSTQDLNMLMNWFDHSNITSAQQARLQIHQRFPDLSRDVLTLGIAYGYQRLRPIQEEVNALWERLGTAQPLAGNYFPLDHTRAVITPTEVGMEDKLLIAGMDLAALRLRLAELAMATRVRNVVRQTLLRDLRQRLAAADPPMQTLTEEEWRQF